MRGALRHHFVYGGWSCLSVMAHVYIECDVIRGIEAGSKLQDAAGNPMGSLEILEETFV